MDIFLNLYAIVGEYLDKRITLRELESWMGQRMLLFYDRPDSKAAKLAHVVELYLSELHDGLRTERSLRRALAKYNSRGKNHTGP